MRVRWLFVLLLVSVMVALAPLAYIELPDQIWLGGLFDGADENDAIVQIQTQLNAVEPPALTVAPGSVPCIHARPQPNAWSRVRSSRHVILALLPPCSVLRS